MAHVLIVHESEIIRGDIHRALLGEGFTVTEADSPQAAIRELWAGTFDAAMISSQMPKISGTPLDEHLRSLAPEIVTVGITRDPTARQVRKLVEVLDGGIAA